MHFNVVKIYFEPISDSSSDYNDKMRSKQLFISKEWKHVQLYVV